MNLKSGSCLRFFEAVVHASPATDYSARSAPTCALSLYVFLQLRLVVSPVLCRETAKPTRSFLQLCEQAKTSECPLWFTSTATKKLHPSLPLNTAVVLPVRLAADSDDENKRADDTCYMAVRSV